MGVDFVSRKSRPFVCNHMSAKNPKKPAVAKLVPAVPPSPPTADADDMSLEAPIQPVLEELKAFYESILPPDVAEDWHLATTLYLETHPIMQERLQAMRSRRIEKSATVPTAKPSATAEAKRAGHQ
jgi:hypothetical protein